MLKVNNKDKNDTSDILKHILHLFNVPIVDFEQLIVWLVLVEMFH